MVTLDVHAKEKTFGNERAITVTLHNPTQHVALMAHVQLRRASGERVLPVYYSDNYVSLAPDETRTIEIHTAASDLDGQRATIAVDGWNTTTEEEKAGGVTIEPNRDAEPDLQTATGFEVLKTGLQ